MNPNDSNARTLAYPRITPEYLESLIVSEEYFHSHIARTTTLVVTLDNKYSETATVTCGSTQLFDEQIGRSRAKQKLIAILQEKEYYAMRRYLHMTQQPEGKSHG